MKVSTLIKKLNEIKNEYGDIQVGFELLTAQFHDDEFLRDEPAVSAVEILGVQNVGSEERDRQFNTVILGTTLQKSSICS